MEIHRFPARRRDYAGRAITGPLTPVVNRFVRERLRLIPHEQRREQPPIAVRSAAPQPYPYWVPSGLRRLRRGAFISSHVMGGPIL